MIGPVRGSTSQMVYLGLGAAGVPIFAGAAGGAAVLSGPTAGYLLGFVVAPLIVGRWIGTGADYRRTLIVFFAGALAILTLGVLHLAVFYTGDLAAAVRVGLLPFVPGDIIKVLAAASIYCGYRRL
jgi:biotin transport system substrate-specific component